MQLRTVYRIESAVQSITSCTVPTVQVGAVVAAADHLRSPYVSRRTVEYRVEAEYQLPPEAVYAASARYALLIGVASEPERVVPPFPVDGYVAAWEGGLVPVTLVQPVFGLARELGFRPQAPHGELVPVWVLTPVLAGWHYSRPVFYAATGDNTPVELDGEPAYQQGDLLVGWSSDDVPQAPKWTAWAGRPVEWVVDHSTAYEGRERAMNTPPAHASATPVAVLYQGETHAAVRLVGPATIVAPDHGDLSIPEGNFIAIHPFPHRGGKME